MSEPIDAAEVIGAVEGRDIESPKARNDPSISICAYRDSSATGPGDTESAARTTDRRTEVRVSLGNDDLSPITSVNIRTRLPHPDDCDSCSTRRSGWIKRDSVVKVDAIR